MKGEAKGMEKWGGGEHQRPLSSPGPRMGCTHLGGGGRFFEPVPQGREGMSAFWGWLCCQDTSLYSPLPPTPPPHLEALALETSEPRQQLQNLGTSSLLGWRVGRGHEWEGFGEGLFDLKPSPCRGQRRAPPTGLSF